MIGLRLGLVDPLPRIVVGGRRQSRADAYASVCLCCCVLVPFFLLVPRLMFALCFVLVIFLPGLRVLDFLKVVG